MTIEEKSIAVTNAKLDKANDDLKKGITSRKEHNDAIVRIERNAHKD